MTRPTEHDLLGHCYTRESEPELFRFNRFHVIAVLAVLSWLTLSGLISLAVLVTMGGGNG